MSKTTIAIIIVIYAVSIFVVGIFGLSIKAYDKVKYVDNITVTIEADNHEMYKIEDVTKQEAGADHEYHLFVNFYTNHLEDRGEKYLPLSIIPHVVYTSGDVASVEEKIKYISDDNMQGFQDKGVVSFSNGQLVINDPEGKIDDPTFFSFKLTISPQNPSKNGSSAVVWVYVLNDDF